MKELLIGLIQQALRKIAPQLSETDLERVQVTYSKQVDHGDFASNAALVFSKILAMSPKQLAQQLQESILTHAAIEKIEIAGPGFINFYLNQTKRLDVIPEIIRQNLDYGRSDLGKNKKVIIEFVSSNPTGPLHVGHGRSAAYGAALSNILKFTQHQVHREYYVNDAGRQMDILTVSVWLRYLIYCEQSIPFPSNAYQGDYVIKIAEEIYEAHRDEYLVLSEELLSDLPPDEPSGGDKEIYIDALIERSKQVLGEANYRTIHAISLNMILSQIKEDLKAFHVEFDEWFSECRLFSEKLLDKTVQHLKDKGLTYEKEKALWFESTCFGDDKDRVLIRANGQATYFAPDVAYHANKFDRGFDQVIDVFGADHHGYVPRVRAALDALGYKTDHFEVPIIQFATLYRGEEKVQMSTRSGQYVTLRALIDEVGSDAARYFYVHRKHEQHMDFDLALAKSQSQNNPVYSIQYAYARICSIFRQLTEKELNFDKNAVESEQLEKLSNDYEFALIAKLTRFPEVIRAAAVHKEPHQVAHYLHELACDFHTYYHQNKFLVADDAIRTARLALIAAIRIVLGNGLTLLDVTAPEIM